MLGTGISPGALGARVTLPPLHPTMTRSLSEKAMLGKRMVSVSLHLSVYTRVVHPPGFRQDAADIAILSAAGISIIFCEAPSASSAALNVMAEVWDRQVVQAQHTFQDPDQHVTLQVLFAKYLLLCTSRTLEQGKAAAQLNRRKQNSP